jgi:hypothetical protein
LQKSLPPSFNKWNRAPKEGYAEGVAARLGWKAWLEGVAARCGWKVWLKGMSARAGLEGVAANMFWRARRQVCSGRRG